MPKLGMEHIRRAALVKATIAEVGAAGSLEVTVGQIAKRAGVSSALAHHYFGGKEQIFLAAMRHILSNYGAQVRASLRGTTTPYARLYAIIEASFAPENFDAEVVGAWLNFYVLAQRSTGARRLLHVYQRRLRSNLIFGLRPLVPADQIESSAEGIASLIDGLYIRRALGPTGPSDPAAITKQYLESLLNRQETI